MKTSNYITAVLVLCAMHTCHAMESLDTLVQIAQFMRDQEIQHDEEQKVLKRTVEPTEAHDQSKRAPEFPTATRLTSAFHHPARPIVKAEQTCLTHIAAPVCVPAISTPSLLFSCIDCGRLFRTKRGLDMHRRIHFRMR